MDALDPILPRIRSRANLLDQTGEWPAADLAELAGAGVMRRAVPAEFGGSDHSPLDVHLLYEKLAAVSLSTALVLSQRDSAAGMIDAAEESPLRGELLPKLARNEQFATIGIAQLTTSRQGGSPSLLATRADGGWRLAGVIPWSTGAAKSDYVVAGATTEDRRQILFVLPTTLPGVRVHPPLPLVALRSSWTSQITCDDALLEDRLVLRGPVPSALTGRKNHLPIGQAFLATGLCRGALDLIGGHDSPRGREMHREFDLQLETVRAQVLRLCLSPGDAGAGPRLRGACNELAVRITTSAVALYKGSALLSDHPAQRLAREALFLLVWSCPDPVVECTVELLARR